MVYGCFVQVFLDDSFPFLLQYNVKETVELKKNIILRNEENICVNLNGN